MLGETRASDYWDIRVRGSSEVVRSDLPAQHWFYLLWSHHSWFSLGSHHSPPAGGVQDLGLVNQHSPASFSTVIGLIMGPWLKLAQSEWILGLSYKRGVAKLGECQFGSAGGDSLEGAFPRIKPKQNLGKTETATSWWCCLSPGCSCAWSPPP